MTTVFGDISTVLDSSSAAVSIAQTTDEALDTVARRLVDAAAPPDVRAAARAIASQWFDLDVVIDAYDDV